MKKINFLVTDSLDQQIEEAMLRLGHSTKAEFFRLLAINCVKDLNIPPRSNTSEGKEARVQTSAQQLSKNEKTILRTLQTGPQLVDTLVGKTGFPVSEVSALLIQLLLKNRVMEAGSHWALA